MDIIIQNLKKFKNDRSLFMKALHDIKASKNNEIVYVSDSNNGYTHEQLLELGTDLNNIFSNFTKGNDYDYEGIPCALYRYVRNFGKAQERKIVYDEDGYDEEGYNQDDYRVNKEHIKFSEDPAVNYKDEYYRCINKLKQYNFTVKSVSIKPTRYYNREQSSCFADFNTFIFKCEKGNFKFDVAFSDDCDCIPGIFSIRNITDINSGDIIGGYCDLYSQNKSEYCTKMYLQLLEHESFNHFYNEIYGKYHHLADLLKCPLYCKHKIADANEKLNPCINEHSLDLYLRLNTAKGDVLLIPYASDYHDEIYLYLSTVTYKTKKSWINNKSETIQVNNLSDFRNIKDERFKILYKSEEQIPDLKLLIDKYIDYTSGKYGFLEGNKYYNRDDIDKCLNNEDIIDNNNYEIYIQHNDNILIDKYIDTTVMLNVSFENDYACLNDNELYQSLHYPLDRYKLHFSYNKGDTDCTLRIEGSYQYADDIARAYYHEGLDNYTNVIYNITDPIIIKGNMSDLLKQAKMLIDML